MKYRVKKSVRFRGGDLKVGNILELQKGSMDLINLMQVGAIENYVEPTQEENKSVEKEKDQESLFKSGSKKNK